MERVYSCEVIIYAEPCDVLQFLPFKNVRHYLAIYHDKDTNSDGTPKKPHSHFYLTLTQNMSFNQIANIFDCLQSININVLAENVSKIKTCLADCYQYALHRNAPDKYQYLESDLYYDDLKPFIDGVSCNRNTALEIMQDLDNDNVNIRDMVVRYGRDLIINYRKYLEFYQVFYKSNNKFEKSS